MSSINLLEHAPRLVHYHPVHFKKLLAWKSIDYQMIHELIQVSGFDEYNHLIAINSIFSSAPAGMPRDRTQTIQQPFEFEIWRPWQIPKISYSLSQAMQLRVEQLLSTHDRINLCWSGGIDSTALVTAFLQHANDRSRLRVLYSPWSMYEHPEYLEFLKKFDNLELVDTSGDVYMDHEFDGIFVTGDGGDENMASVDESFLATHGPDVMNQPWQDFFYRQDPRANFIEFCKRYFSLSGLEIKTVLQARWWYYTCCKTYCLWAKKLDFFVGYKNFHPNMLIPFYNCEPFENYIYNRIDTIMPGNQYQNWKIELKQYCAKFDGFLDWAEHKTKTHSNQMTLYGHKKMILDDQRYICILSDGTRITTDNLPLLSQKEFDHCYQNKLDYLFNDPV
jgi:hypothetical protein